MYHIVVLFLCLSLFASSSHANILNIPDDHETIQQGLNAAEDGDTVLVQEGRYVENLTFPNDISVTLASTRLFDDDDGIIERTVIDGNRDGTVITVNMENDSPVVIIGFTITNGQNREFGGGLFCTGANVVLQKVVIAENRANHGGTMYLMNSSLRLDDFNLTENNADRSCNYLAGDVELILNDGFVTDNYASIGGAFYSAGERNRIEVNNVIFLGDTVKNRGSFFYGENAEVILERVLIAKEMGWYDGLIHATNCEFDFNFVTISGNCTGQSVSDMRFEDCVVTIRNSIAWYGYRSDWIGTQSVNSEISVSYSNLNTGIRDVNVGEGMIEGEPLFVDFENNDFRLSPGSPCLDTADPENDLDLDGTRADMGMFPRFRPVYLHGSVFAASGNGAIDGAHIEFSSGERLISNEQGFWSTNTIPGENDITYRADGYPDSTIHINEYGAGDTLEINTGLLRPEFNPDYDEIEWDVLREESADVVVTLSNPGNGALSWSMEILETDSTVLEPWELVNSHPIFDITGDNLIRGVVRVDGLNYLSGDRAEPPMIYVVNDNGELVNQFQQPGEGHRGIRGMTLKDEKIWGVASHSIIGFDTNGENVEIIEFDQNIVSDVAFDPVREMFWTVYSSTNILGYDTNGQQVDEIPNENRIYGIAYNEHSEDGFCLTAIGLDDRDRRIILLINPETDEIRHLITLRGVSGTRPCGAFISRGFSNRNALCFMYVESAGFEDGGDRLDIYNLDYNFFWINSNTTEGMLEPESSNQVLLVLSTVEPEQDFVLPYGTFSATLRFDLETLRSELYLPVTMNVVHPDFVNSDRSIPDNFIITSVSPNPFNSTATISYNITRSCNVKISICDIHGRELTVLRDRIQSAGQNSVLWNAWELPSGLYLCRIEAGGEVATAKLLLVK